MIFFSRISSSILEDIFKKKFFGFLEKKKRLFVEVLLGKSFGKKKVLIWKKLETKQTNWFFGNP